MIIFNADDFGLCESINAAIIKSYQDGVVRSATLMANGLAFEDAVQLANENPSLGVGIHLVVSMLKPLTNPKTLTDTQGNFLKLSQYENLEIDLDELRAEFIAQIEKCLTHDVKLTHIDGHHHLYAIIPGSLKIVEDLAITYHLKIRNYHNQELNALYPIQFSDKFYNVETVEGLIELLQDNTEFMTHPGYEKDDLKQLSSYVTSREKELKILCDENLKNYLEENELKIGNYGGINHA